MTKRQNRQSCSMVIRAALKGIMVGTHLHCCWMMVAVIIVTWIVAFGPFAMMPCFVDRSHLFVAGVGCCCRRMNLSSVGKFAGVALGLGVMRAPDCTSSLCCPSFVVPLSVLLQSLRISLDLASCWSSHPWAPLIKALAVRLVQLAWWEVRVYWQLFESLVASWVLRSLLPQSFLIWLEHQVSFWAICRISLFCFQISTVDRASSWCRPTFCWCTSQSWIARLGSYWRLDQASKIL